MPQSFARIPVHFIWSTRDREPFIKTDIENQLHKYMTEIFRDCESPVIKINGTEDHIHVLSLLSRKITTSDLVEEVKKYSSKWIKTKGEIYQKFYWQHGYGAFGIGESNIEKLERYIENQKEHHEQMTFKEEYRKFLQKYNIDYDERYVWD